MRRTEVPVPHNLNLCHLGLPKPSTTPYICETTENYKNKKKKIQKGIKIKLIVAGDNQPVCEVE